MNRIATRVSIRAFAVFVLVMGVVAGVYLSVGDPSGRPLAGQREAASVGLGGPGAAEEVSQRKQAANDAYRRQLLQDASRSAARAAAQKAAEAGESAAQRAKAANAAANPSGGGTIPIPASCKEFTGNPAVACAILPQFGFGIEQMSCLVPLWNKESGWNPHAGNASGAYGIPQALPGDKMAQYGDDWADNPVTQIKWGLSYIKGRYNDPCGAWDTWQANGWY